MSRCLVTGIFLVLAVATGAGVVESWGEFLGDATVRTFAVGTYSTLKLGVVFAFSFFVFVREPARRPSRDPVAFAACATAIAAVVALRAPSPEANTAAVVVGDLVTLASCVWLLVAVLALGRCFGVLPEARGLVTHGPYRIVRHPVYLGEFGAAAGLVVAAPEAWNVGVLVTFVAAQAVRMRLEERELSASFPDYAVYAARTPRLIPRLPLVGGRPVTEDN